MATTVAERGDDLPFSARVRTRLGLALFVGLAYVPLLLTDVGKIDADTKAYLYLDPGRLLSGAASMWDSTVGLGTVSYQTLGYLFPMGPFYWLLERLVGLPPWIAERLWLGTLILAAGLGTRYLLRVLGVRGPGVAVGMLAYAFTPYAIQFSTRASGLLGPWAAMPWITAFIVLALRRGGWKYPALMAITVQLAGSVNASTLIFTLVAPALLILYSVLVVRESTWRRAWSVVWRSALLILITSLWWMIALLVEGGYGINILSFTETLKTTSSTTFPIELLRGLGYWFLYGRDAKSLWVAGMSSFTRNPGVIFVSILLPALAILAAVAVRWRYRVYFVLLVVVGVAIGVGAAPYNNPSPAGAAFQSFAASSSLGLALRNSARAVPLVALGLAMLLAAFVSALNERLRGSGRVRAGIVVAILIGALCLANAPGVWGGHYYSPYNEWRSIPEYWNQAARSLDAKSHNTRVLALPGSPFAAFTWGDLEDPIEPALMTRPFVTRQVVPEGSEATANLVQALDSRVQGGVLDPNALAPVARLMGVGDVLLDMDLQTDRYGIIPADQLWNTFTDPVPTGLTTPEKFGTKIPGDPILDIDDVARPSLPSPPPLAVVSVKQPLAIVRTKSAADPIVIDGDGDGLIDAASAGLLDARRLVLYSAQYEGDPAVLRALPNGATLVVTDSNRKSPRSNALSRYYGPTEQADEKPLVKSPTDQRLDVFPGSTPASQTVTVLHGVASVQATSGDQPFNMIPMRPSLMLDGNVKTGWLVDGAVAVGPERVRIRFDKPITTDHINLVQPLRAGQGRWITRVTLSFDGHNAVHSDLDDSSRTASGQTVQFPARRFSTLEIRIDRVHHQTAGFPENAVGFSEVRVSGDSPGAQPLRVEESARPPQDLLRALGKASINHPLTFLFSRNLMDDTAMTRQVSLPTARAFSLSGTALLAKEATDDALDHRLGLPDAGSGGVTVTSSVRFEDPLARGSSAIDGDLATAWNTPLGGARGSIEVEVPKPITFDHMDLRLVDDGKHSVPTRLRLESDDGTKRVIDLSTVQHTRGPDNTVSVPLHFDPIGGRRFTVSIVDVNARVIKTAAKPAGVLMPSAIAELGIPGVMRGPMPSQLPTACINNLIAIDGKPFPIRVTGSTADALQQRPLSVEPCNSNEAVKLGAGTHEIRAVEGPDTATGLDIQHLVLASGPRGAASRGVATSGAAPSNGSSPPVRVLHRTNSSMTLRVAAASKPFWLVLGESFNRGWAAKADGHDLGKQSLVDGYANGWLVRPRTPAREMTITLEWTPQRFVRAALPLSALGYLLCLGIVAVAFIRDRRRRVVNVATDNAPTLVGSSLPPPLERKRGAIIGTVIAMTAAATLLVAPWIGLVVGVLVLLAILRPRWHRAVRLAPAILIGVIAIYITLGQILRNYPPVIQWPTHFDLARIPTWIALLLLAADGLIAIVWRTELDDGDTDARGS